MHESSRVHRAVSVILLVLIFCAINLQEKEILRGVFIEDWSIEQSLPASMSGNLPETADNFDTTRTTPSCIWSPKPVNSSYRGTSCMETMIEAISSENAIDGTVLKPKRWMFFGDSTIARLFTRSPLITHFVDVPRMDQACNGIYQCKRHKHGKCNLPNAFGMQPAPNGWIAPNYTLAEGPVAAGTKKAYCQDCSGCNSEYALCTLLNATNEPSSSDCATASVHGAYWSVEFARDVELQTPQYQTTQENLVSFLRQHVNQDANFIQQMGGLPVCVVSMGLHDMRIPGITIDLFAQNVNWFLQLLSSQCSHILWLPNAAPLQKATGQHPQSQETIRKCNEAVAHQVLPKLNISTSILDVWDASIGWPHDNKNRDNVHMADEWYHALGSFLVELSQTLLEQATQMSLFLNLGTISSCCTRLHEFLSYSMRRFREPAACNLSSTS